MNIGDSNLYGDKRDVEFWWIITLRGHEVLSSIAEPLFEIKCLDGHLSSLQNEAIYLALVRVVKPLPAYKFKYRTLFQELGYLGLMETNERDSLSNLSLRSTSGDPEEVIRRIRGWLLRCDKHKTCSTKATNRAAHPKGFCLFDITALKVVDAAGYEPYIALSYPSSHIDEFEIKRDEPYILADLPNVLQDVVRLVRSLGFGVNHIWMDRLCIDPDNQEQETTNINAMGDIYGAAFATVILAVPSREYVEKGIPGLSAPRPKYQRIENIGNTIVATTYPSLDMAIVTSNWNTRAWTFQEGLLSSRCILFGPEQCHFECAEMGCWESIIEPELATSKDDHLIPYKSRLRNLFLDPYDFDSLYWRLVHEYTGRDITFNSDSLRAFAAFTTEFRRAGRILTWGLPISSSALNLLWEHSPWDFCDIKRRSQFPSWSWAGWSGTATMNFQLDSGQKVSRTCAIAHESSHSHILICKARSVKVSITGQFPLLALASAPDSSIMLDRGMNATLEDIPHDFLMMEICQETDFVHGLLVVEKKDNILNFERIGSGFMRLTDFENAELTSHELKLV